MRMVLSKVMVALALMLMAGTAAAAEGISWQGDYAKALDAAAKNIQPVLVVFDRVTGGESAKDATTRLEGSEDFRQAAPKCVLARVEGFKIAETEALAWYKDEAEAPGGAVVRPDGKPLKVYTQLPDAAEVAKDMTDGVVEVLLSEADKSVGEGNDRRAVAIYWQVLTSRPSPPVVERTKRALAEASRRGRARISQVEPMLEARQFLKARRYLDALSVDYAGTDAARVATDRVAELLKDSAINAEIIRQQKEEEAVKLLAEARKLAAEDPEAARLTYQRLVDLYPDSDTAKGASAEVAKACNTSPEGPDPKLKRMDEDCRTWMSYGDTLAGQGKQVQAMKYYKMIITNYPDSAFRSTAEEKMKRLE